MLGQSRHVQLCQFLLLHSIRRIDKLRCVPEHARAVEDEPGDGEPEEEGDVDRFAEAAACALVLDGVEQPDELVLFQLAVAIGADAHHGLQRLVLRAVRHERERGSWIRVLRFRRWLSGFGRGRGWRHLLV